ncbi:MAG TPA: hypothetical protein VFO78_04165 [Candidatus Limnocylindrales bacterium]|nr:hypothetical protein [Candidatus Limnocylindrales bacterium]
MRLSEWRAASPSREAASRKISALVDPILAALGAEADPGAWVVWGEEPATRYTILVPTPAGLVSCFVRVNVPGEGPRAAAKLIRWNRLQLGELAVEAQGGHRLLTFQVEGNVLRGVDETADGVGRFAVELFAAVDGRPPPVDGRPRPRRAAVSAARRTGGKAAPVGKPAPVGQPALGGKPAAGGSEGTARSGAGRTPAVRPRQRG